jgi:hypothetical protein
VTQADHQGADAQQAAYFRAELDAERRLLLADIGKRRALIDRPGDAGHRVRATGAEAEVRHIDWLIARLDGRFAVERDERG